MDKPLLQVLATTRALPDGYDAICVSCKQPYTFSNAKALHVPRPACEKFCSKTCYYGKKLNPRLRQLGVI